MVLFKIKVNSCILKHPINYYKIWVESLRILYLIYTTIFSIPQVTNFRPPSFTFLLLIHSEPLTPYYQDPFNFSIFFPRCLVASGVRATWKKNELFSFFWKEDCYTNKALTFSLLACGLRPLTPHWNLWFSNVKQTNLQNHPSKHFQQKSCFFIH